MKKLWIWLALFLAGCSAGPDITSYFHSDNVDISDLKSDTSTTTVSMILPLSGTWETTGKTFQKASLLALDDNPNAPIKILFFDTQSTAEGTQKAYNQALAQNPHLILGPVFADEFRALPSPGLTNKPVLGYTSDNTLLNSERASMAVLIPEQINALVRQNCLSGKRKLAVIGPEGKTGEIVMNALTEALPLCPDMELQSYALYDAKKADMSADILKILPPFINPKKKNLTEKEQELLATPMEERLKFDSLLVFEDGTKLTQVMSTLAFYDVSPSLIPIYTLASAKGVKDRSLNGVLMADLPADNTFSKKYKNAFGVPPLRLASLAYDSVDWVAKVAPKGPVSLKTLREAGVYRGVDGLVKLNPDGTNKRGLRIVRKTSRGVAEVAPAPSDLNEELFMDLLNDSMIITKSADSTSTFPPQSGESPLNFESPNRDAPLL
ncbi:MAG: penicillin-binding protein activator [Alphaproteobacteria bacterium]